MKLSSRPCIILGAIIGPSSSCCGAFLVAPSTRRVSLRISNWHVSSGDGCPIMASRRRLKVPTTTVTALFESSKDNKEQDPDRKNNDISPVPALPLSYLAGAVVFVMFWPILAVLRVYFSGSDSPLAGFDLDMFMALKGILETSPNAMNGDTIMELPPLSPAEQLVGAIFGPP